MQPNLAIWIFLSKFHKPFTVTWYTKFYVPLICVRSTEEKKPLTEEEKKQQLALIDEKIKIKRAEREKREKEEALEREKLRIKSGKDMTEVKRKMEEDEMKKIVSLP